MSNWREPITDRTIADVRNYDAGSLDCQKGALNADDLNRIEDNYKYLMAKLRSDAIFIPHRLRNYTETVLEYVQTGEAGPEYTLMEYLESTGTQYIDTLYKFTSENATVEIGFEFTEAPTGNSLFGSEAAGHYSIVAYGHGNTNMGLYVGKSGGLLVKTISTNTHYDLIVKANNNTLTESLNGSVTSGTYTGSVQNGRNIAIFANNIYSGIGQYAKMKLKYFRMKDNDMLVRDYIPVIDANGEACLYDKLNHVYYRNKGTGAFTSGPEVPEVPVETEPVYELIETQTTYTDWQENNLPWLSEINRIRANYNALVRLFLVGLGFPVLVESNYLDYVEVNNWEKFALFGKTMFENMEKEYRFCGMENSGGERLL